MEKLLDYFTIDGEFGGNQDWFTNIVMHIGGCAAATACDSCIYFAKHKGMEFLYPYDINRLNKEDYKRFSQIMKPYIRPRVNGVKRLNWYIEGLERYLKDAGNQTGSAYGNQTGSDYGNQTGSAYGNRTGSDYGIQMEELSGESAYEEASARIKRQIDEGFPVPYLMLRHRLSEKYKDFIWHWFLAVGYEETDEGLWIIAATYGEKVRLLLKELWDTGFEEKGGVILYSFPQQDV